MYNIEPVGIGTPYVESLTSYITRLADAHCIKTGTLISCIYAPYLKKDYLNKISIRGGGFYESANGINGVGKLAEEFSDLTKELTGRSDITRTTLKQWSCMLPTMGLLKKNKSWCPNCYEEAKLNKRIVYDKLIWNFQLVKYCLFHKTPLVEYCCSCGKENRVVDRNSAPGICSKCGSWLGSISPQEMVNNELLKDIELIGDFLAVDESNKIQGTVLDSLQFYLRVYFGSSKNKAASALNVPKSTFSTWVSGDSHPNIYNLVHICKVLDVSINQFLRRETPTFKSEFSTGCINSTKKTHDHMEILNVLKRIINSKEAVSISEIAKWVGCDRRLLSRKYKVECEQIKKRHIAFIEQQKNERYLKKINQLNSAFYSLLEQSIYPSRRQLESVLGSGFLKETSLQEYWNQLKRESKIMRRS